ncbi:MAG: metal ABC transporter permease [Gemmataceae bacterium]
MIGPVLAQEGIHWVDGILHAIADAAPPNTFLSYAFNLRAMIALIMVSLCCGAVGALVVGGKMAFFSDAIAHSAFASVSIGFILFATVIGRYRPASEFWDWVTPIMLIFGMLVGYGIAFVRERTGLASDTVIGVFFAFAIGLAAMLGKIMQSRDLFRLEDFLFGDPLLVRGEDLVYLGILTLVTGGVLTCIFNSLLLSGFNTSLALSRQIPTRFVGYLFIMLLALVVNLCVRTVGALLINALLVVPAATAANVCSNLRSVFWTTVGLCFGSCLVGQVISWEVESHTNLRLGIPGTIILVSVSGFILSAIFGPMLRHRPAAL